MENGLTSLAGKVYKKLQQQALQREIIINGANVLVGMKKWAQFKRPELGYTVDPSRRRAEKNEGWLSSV